MLLRFGRKLILRLLSNLQLFDVRRLLYWLILICRTPAVVTGLLLLTSFGHMVKDIDPIFQCGTNQVSGMFSDNCFSNPLIVIAS